MAMDVAAQADEFARALGERLQQVGHGALTAAAG
jgi:hypothetical protein